jgi:hypothetical protein
MNAFQSVVSKVISNKLALFALLIVSTFMMTGLQCACNAR